jgi:glycosyltransferase involved in cell wall biosynthesis
MTMPTLQPTLSIVVPVHNEEAILEEQVLAMRSAFDEFGHPYELILVENGSSDATPQICEKLSKSFREVRTISTKTPDYGIALRDGILGAVNDVVIVFNVEFWSIEFVAIAVAALRSRVLVIGSKSAPGATDERPWLRRAVTGGYNRCLRLVWGFRGTDTHGMKAFHREALVPIVSQCRCTGFVFDTELVLRCERAGLSRLELPTDVKELRAPSRLSLLKRVPNVLRNLLTLWQSVR